MPRFSCPDTAPAEWSPLEIVLPATAGDDELRVSVNYLYCRDGSEGLCKIASTVWELPLTIQAEQGPEKIELRAAGK